MRFLLASTLLILVCSCATAPPKAAPSNGARLEVLRAPEMEALAARVTRAKARGELRELREALERAAVGRDPWALVEAAFAQMSEDADGAWNRLREVTASTGLPGPTYWAHLGMADVYLQWKDAGQARSEIDAALAIGPESAPALLRVARLSVLQGQPEEAQAALARALEVGGGPASSPSVAVELAHLRHAEGKDGEARALLEGVLEGHPERIDALLLAAEIVPEDEAGAKAAVSLLTTAVKAAPGESELKIRLARAEERAGDVAGALAAWQAVTVDRPKDLDAWRTQVRLAREVEDAGAEAAALEQVARIDPMEVEALRRLAQLQLGSAKLREAEASYSELLARRDRDPEALLARARIREELQDLLGAVGDYREAAQIGAEQATAGLTNLSARIGLPERPVGGRTPEAVYGAVAKVLGQAYLSRLTELPRLGGTYSIKVRVKDGGVVSAEVAENTLHDPIMEALAWWLVQDAGFPKTAGRKEYTLPFTFAPPD